MTPTPTASPLDTRPADVDDVTLPQLGPIGMMRWVWRQLASMRTALFLLLLLAVGAVPGSIWPQRNIDASKVADYLVQHPSSGPWLDRVGFFDVYASPWFASIYLLLFISLVGCVLPRSRVHWQAMRAEPPRAPKRLQRLPEHATAVIEASQAEILLAARQVLRAKHFRIRTVHDDEADAVSAERGYLRETGNLVFHLALIVVIVAVGVGHLFGWRGDVIVPVGQSFSSTVSGYDTMDPGPWVDPERLAPFSLAVDRLDVTFEERADGAQFGAPRDFTAFTTTREGFSVPEERQVLKVNQPLTLGGASVFLLGNGYAPVIIVRDARGQVLYSQASPFLPQDNNYRSVGAVKVPGASPKQLGFAGLFLPSAVIDKNVGPTSYFPDLKAPALALTAWEGDLYPGGRPQSVYSLRTQSMTQLKSANGQPLRIWLTPGATVKLPGGRGSISMGSVPRFAGLSVRHDPGKMLALGGSLAALTGLVLSLVIRRRRIFIRVTPAASQEADGAGNHPARPRTTVTIGGLAKGQDAAFAAYITDLLATITERTGRTT